MKKSLILLAIALPALAFVGFSFTNDGPPPADTDWNACIEKYESGWDTRCRDCPVSTGTYKVKLRNTCDQKVDLMCCVQNQYKKWRCFHRNGMIPNDSLIAYDCKGTGKYLKWVKRAGDTETMFPTNAEVNAQYTK